MGEGSETGARLAELLAALSLGIDLGFGQPMEHVLRQCRIASSWEAVLAGEPALRVLSAAELDEALEAIARFVDLKSPFMLGHSQAVATLARDAAACLDLPAAERTRLYRAGLTAGFGRLGVSNAIWDKPGPLTVAEWERVRLAPQLAERMLR